MGTTERAAHNGLPTTITDNVEDGQFEVSAEGAIIGRQPYRRYGGHIVLLSTEVDPQWRGRGVSSALIDGVLGLIAAAESTVVPRCKLTGDYILHHPQYRSLVAEQYQSLLRPISRPDTEADPQSATTES